MKRVLFFAPRDCRPPNTGGKLRNYHLCRELSRDAHVTYLSFEEPGAADLEDPPPLEEMAQRVITVPHENHVSPWQLLRGLTQPWPLSVLNYTTPAMQAQLSALLRRECFDVVLMQSLFLAAYMPLFKQARIRPLIICDWQNVESEVLERYAAHAPNLARKFYANATARRMATLEKQQLPRFDAHFTVSDRDTQHLRALSPASTVWTLENGTETAGFASGESGGVQVRRFAERRQKDRRQNQIPLPEGQEDRRKGERRKAERRERALPHRILFVGSMDYYPNTEAALFFVQEIWPDLHAQRPDWVFTIVGRNPSPAVQQLAETPGVEVTGTVPDVRPFYRQALASVVPLRVGGGSRLKILEAMAARVPVVSTTLGAEGLEVCDGETILIRDDPHEIASALGHLADDAQVRQDMVEQAHQLVLSRYDWSAIGARLRSFCADLIESKERLQKS